MPTPQRLPVVNGDDGQWGDILVQWLKKEHYDDGTDNSVNGGHQNVTLQAGTAASGTAPLKFSSGTLLSSAEAGALEFLTDKIYFTISTGTTRKTIAIYDDSGGATGDIYYRDSSGNFIKLGIGGSGDVLTVASGLPAWQTPSGGGDASTNTITSVDSEVALFSGTGGKTIKRASGTGIANLSSGVLSTKSTTGSGDVVLSIAPTLTGTTTIWDETSTHGSITLLTGSFFGIGIQVVSLFGNSTDTQPVMQILGSANGGSSITLGPGGSTGTDIGFTRTGTGTASVNGTWTFSSAPVIPTMSNSGILTLPTSTDTLVGRATTDTFTNKRIT